MTKADPHPALWHIGEYPTDTFFSNEAMYHLPALRSVIISYSQNPNQTSCWFMSIGQTPEVGPKKPTLGNHYEAERDQAHQSEIFCQNLPDANIPN